MKQITYRTAAAKALRKMQPSIAKRIVSKIEAYAENPEAFAGNVVTLQGREGIRLRVGDYRVIMLDGEVLDVIDIGNRREIYR